MSLRLLAFAFLAFFAVACGPADDEAAAWLANAQAAHAEADDESVDEAIATLEAFARLAPPEGVDARDARIVRQDLFYRVSRLALDSGDASRARALADEGLALGRGDDLFTANLLVARGQAREAEGDALGASEDYHDALLINDALLQQVLGAAPEEDE